jgi:hypothetical protein
MTNPTSLVSNNKLIKEANIKGQWIWVDGISNNIGLPTKTL